MPRTRSTQAQKPWMKAPSARQTRGAIGAAPEMVLLVYDVGDAQRLRRVAQVCEAYGQRVQRSVFELHLRPGQLQALQRKLRAVLLPHVDQVRYYRLCAADVPDVLMDGVGSATEAHRYTVC